MCVCEKLLVIKLQDMVHEYLSFVVCDMVHIHVSILLWLSANCLLSLCFWKDRVFGVTWKKLNNCVVIMILTNHYSFCSASLLRMSRGSKLLRKWMS